MLAHIKFSASASKRWLACPGFEGLYEVSEGGQVRNVVRGNVLSPYPFSNGYLGVKLGRKNVKLVHRLVAQAFIAGDTSLQVNHKDGNRTNNVVSNLEWVTASANVKHSYDELNRKPHSFKRRVSVGSRVFCSGVDAAKFLGVVPGSVASAALRGHKCKGQEVAYV